MLWAAAKYFAIDLEYYDMSEENPPFLSDECRCYWCTGNEMGSESPALAGLRMVKDDLQTVPTVDWDKRKIELLEGEYHRASQERMLKSLGALTDALRVGADGLFLNTYVCKNLKMNRFPVYKVGDGPRAEQLASVMKAFNERYFSSE